MEPASWRRNSISSVEANLLVSSVAVETLSSVVNRNHYSIRIVEFSKSVRQCPTAVNQISPA